MTFETGRVKLAGYLKAVQDFSLGTDADCLTQSKVVAHRASRAKQGDNALFQCL
jgi:hypothetical protein